MSRFVSRGANSRRTSTERDRSHVHRFIPSPEGRGAGAPPDIAQIEAIKRWTRETLRLSADVVVTVSEIACVDPGCPLMETAIAVFEEGAPARCWRFTRPRAAVTRLMVRQTLATPPRSG